SDPGDIIILLGGRTGRDGCGGATGSSKAHTESSIETCGAEVQKGNAPTERKIQRLFRREEVASLIKKCNDFGAGGVSVAIGELADGLRVDLDKVPKKYAGLDGTELAISESQERMAVVVAPEDVDKMMQYVAEENLEAVAVAVVTEEKRLVLSWRGKEIVNLSRAFLDTNGAHQETDVKVSMPDADDKYFEQKNETGDVKKLWLDTLSDLNVCSQKGLVEMFDSSIGAGSVTMPYGGKYQLSETQTMIAKLPVLKGKTDTVTMMSYGFDPYLSSWSPYHGSIYAVLLSVAKIAASGGDVSKIHLTFQEYFKRLGTDPYRWGQPLSALLGAYDVQMGLGLASIGGKDSMSGSFNDIDVPPTLVSFAVDVASYQDVVTPELKKAGNLLVQFDIKKDAYDIPDYKDVLEKYGKLYEAVCAGKVVSAYAVGFGGMIEALSKMAFGNKLGVKISGTVSKDDLTAKNYGSIILEVSQDDVTALGIPCTVIGEVQASAQFEYADTVISMEDALQAWTGKLEKVFPTESGVEQNDKINDALKIENGIVTSKMYDAGSILIAKNKVAKPKVFIPVFPGTNCEYDSAKAFENAGADVNTIVFRNMDAQGIRDSVDAFTKAIRESQIIMFPGGFSAGDEPDGSGKFIATAFRNAKIADEVMKLLNERDGLVLGICNGFQALIKLGLVPYGEIRPQEDDSPTLAMNSIGRHQSKMVYTKVVTNKSPWLSQAKLGGVYSVPISRGEGRFVASKEWTERLFANGQVATQYVDIDGNPTMDEYYNVNGSYYAIEGITSPDGRVLGKMAHSERKGTAVAVNIYGDQDQKIFESGVAYFS
ncbi:MAG: phosphoribosylformylglycinamidine synthase, partial [Wujia sp.]